MLRLDGNPSWEGDGVWESRAKCCEILDKRQGENKRDDHWAIGAKSDTIGDYTIAVFCISCKYSQNKDQT